MYVNNTAKMTGFYLLILLLATTSSTPLDDLNTRDVKPIPVAQQKCEEYIKSSSASTAPNTPTTPKPTPTTRPAEKTEYPHMARIGYDRNSGRILFCGGSLISEYFVLSLASCKSPLSPVGKVAEYITLGSWSQNPSQDQSSQEFGISQIHQHPGYNSDSLENNIALFKLDKKVEFNEHIKPICLNTKESEYQQIIATGWGTTGYRTPKSKNVISINLFVNSDQKCIEKYSKYYNSSSMICTGAFAEGQDACQGFAGGPLQMISEKTRTYQQIGVISYWDAVYCGRRDTPGFHLEVVPHVSWIEETVWS